MSNISKWRKNFIAKYGDTTTVQRLTNDIRNTQDIEKLQKQADVNLTRVCRGLVRGRRVRKK